MSIASPVADNPIEVVLKQRELRLLQERLEIVKANGLAYYRPHEKQHLFHISTAKRRGVFAGNRFGKSECSAAETVAWFVGERTWYKFSFPIYGMREGKKVVVEFHEGHENHPYVRSGIPRHATKQLIITTDWKKVDIVWTTHLGAPPGKIWKFMPTSAEIETKKNHEGTIDTVWNKLTGAVIRFTTEQAFNKNPQSAESTDNDRLGIDEPIVEDMWKAVSRGLVDRDGCADFTLTSLRERWIYDKFHAEDPNEAELRKFTWFAVRATIFDNPHNTLESIQRFLDELTEDEKECRANGLPLELSGLVYKEFSRDRHVLKDLPSGWTDWGNPPLHWTIYVSIDVHPSTSQAAVFVAVPPMGVPIVYDEIWRSCLADELAEELKLRLAGRVVGFIKADPKAWEEDPVYKVSMAQRFHAHGLPVEKASKAKAFGITNLRGVLKRESIDPASGRRRPEVYFAPTCKRLFWEISRYHYDKENQPIDKDDHFMECLYRVFIAPLTHWDGSVLISIPTPEIPSHREAMHDFAGDMAAFNAHLGLN